MILWVVEMDPRPETCLPGLVQTEAALVIPLDGANGMFFMIGRAAGMAAQEIYTDKVAPRLRGMEHRQVAAITYCNDGQAVFRRVVDHYLYQREVSHWATDLCRLMARHGSDKGIGWHTYTPFYEALLLDRRGTITSVFELGLGTNNEDTPSNMGPHGSPGASLRGWRDYLPHARIYGADVDRRILFNEDRIETFFVDQLDPATFEPLWAAVPEAGFDIFLDDGLHTPEAARITLAASLPKVRAGGYYVIEDVLRDDAAAYLRLIEERGLPGLCIDIPHHANSYDNCLIVAEVS